MSEPRTVKEWAWRYLPAEVYNALMGAKHRGNCEPHISTFLDALIGCQGRVVYTEEDVEAVRAALAPFIYGKEFADLEFLDSDSVGENKLLPMARAAITAAGGVVADEVVPVKSGTQVMFPKPPGRCTLYIVRAKEE